MKKVYRKPELELLRLEVEDILSFGNSLPFVPFDLIAFIDEDDDGIDDREQW